MADKEDKKLAAPLLPPVAVEKKNKKAPLVPAVELTSLWALFAAAIMGVAFAIPYALDHHGIHLPSWMSANSELFTDAAMAELSAIIVGWIWCSAAQSVAAALALVLPAHLRLTRRALACAALAVAAASHLMVGRVVVIFLTADPGWICVWISGTVDMYHLGRGDFYCLMALLGWEEHAGGVPSILLLPRLAAGSVA